MRLDSQAAHRPLDSGLRSELPSLLVAAAAVTLILLVNAGTLGQPDAHPVPAAESIRPAQAHDAALPQDLQASTPFPAGKTAGI